MKLRHLILVIALLILIGWWKGSAQLGPPSGAATASIGGGALLAGACASNTVTITGAVAGMSVIAVPTTYPGDGIYWTSYVSGANTVTVKVCAILALTPASTTYVVKLL